MERDATNAFAGEIRIGNLERHPDRQRDGP